MINSHYINGKWYVGTGELMEAIDPTTGEPSWKGRHATADEIDIAVGVAREALQAWSSLPLKDRIAACQTFADTLRAHHDEMTEAICVSTGKPRWEAKTETDAMIGKVALSVEAYNERCAEQRLELKDHAGVLRYKPHGVLAVLGPFNLPGHLPNGHIVPALIAGNTVVFKPSEQTPLVGQVMCDLWERSGLPAGVVNMVHGGRDAGVTLSQHGGIDGLLFTGSFGAGLALSRAFAEHPDRILALEMGGNNPLVVAPDQIDELNAAAYLTVLSAYITAGQRCTCARRLIIIDGSACDHFIMRLSEMIEQARVGHWDDDPPAFMGPVISEAAAQRVLDAQEKLIAEGGDAVVLCQRPEDETPALLTPGLIDVTTVPGRDDVEIFGPLLQLIRVPDIDAALDEANRTQFGLAAGLFSDDEATWQSFFSRIRAGVVNWNRQTTGASGRLPFGGVGHSGNHRPAGFFSSDYCSFPVASIEADRVAMPEKTMPGIEVR